MTSSRNIIAVAFLLLACCSCQSRKEPIAQLQEQLSKDSITLSDIQRKYPEQIWADFRWCDSMLLFVPEGQVNDYFDALNLAQAYLYQFDEMLPIMNRDLSYTRQQLVNLQNDIDTHFISDSLAAVYLKDEAAVADTLHNRILYFQDRLSKQNKEMQSLKKNIRKATSK